MRNEKFNAKATSTIRKFSIQKRIKPLLRNEWFILQTHDTTKYVMWEFTLLNKLLRLRTVSKKVYSFIFTNGNNKWKFPSNVGSINAKMEKVIFLQLYKSTTLVR